MEQALDISGRTAHTGEHANFFLPPSWIGCDDGRTLALFECAAGDRVELDGSVRSALLRGQTPAALAAMARCEPSLARLHDALQRAALAPLDRAALLRGAGWSTLFVELTARCNERCLHCYADSSPERSEALDEPALRAVLEDARALGFRRVQFTGGDPLVSPLCASGVEYARALGCEVVEVYTNGLALTGRLYERLKRARVAFAFSLYSADPAAHDAITRTPGSQRRTLAAIARVRRDGLPLRVSIVVMPQNREHVDATRALLHEAGVPDEAIGMDVQRSVGRGLMTLRPKYAALSGRSAGHRVPEAFAFDGRAAVSYDGVVLPCIFSRAFPLGRVRERRLAEILRDPVPVAFDGAALGAELARKEEQLACWECRVRGAVLALAAGPGGAA